VNQPASPAGGSYFRHPWTSAKAGPIFSLADWETREMNITAVLTVLALFAIPPAPPIGRARFKKPIFVVGQHDLKPLTHRLSVKLLPA